jgi:hypothetical protein
VVSRCQNLLFQWTFFLSDRVVTGWLNVGAEEWSLVYVDVEEWSLVYFDFLSSDFFLSDV